MPAYANLRGTSGVVAYDDSIHDRIVVEFKDGARYEYTHRSCGQGNVDTMVQLARSGYGLHSYINRRVRRQYACKL